MTPKLIVALDFDNEHDALNLVERFDPERCALKVGSELFTLLGTNFVKQLIKRQFKVFLDLKFHDIPNTVAKACKAGAELGVWMMNVHASGGMSMMQAARKAIDSYGTNRPLLIAVTVLTSFDQVELTSIGVDVPVINQVKNLAILTKESGLDGVVCSAQEVKIIKSACNDQFITVTPGIRLTSNSNDDQSRVMTPKQAIAEGSDFLVVGRPITQATNPELVVDEILSSIQNI
ncbi:orotidine-5'-phosphate decarboxylase [Legionella parisiensis]|uniref:Orotidine 5'-phosphate decarboxylase n=1 Tax=Legionella parisiensis TaxID=45071 RepID=A0A1E5JVJ3_9GAMM|nr:orotidine-5'-phosphate decarboxylase [Legionella parisiensis]KTD41177.1 orotidine 5`-phosphate decarboxylase [Legionella parisiensis]OEH48393.1 Orotidine 5'-phosphate decarboxylase [Legionella parisiensis]STX76524.1 orotidine 5`-phosphate decarboxylase [Legionella parisiensis]